MESGDEFFDVAIAGDWDDFAVFYEDEGCHAAVWVSGEFDIAFVFDGADCFGDWDYDWDWVEVAGFNVHLRFVLRLYCMKSGMVMRIFSRSSGGSRPQSETG